MGPSVRFAMDDVTVPNGGMFRRPKMVLPRVDLSAGERYKLGTGERA